MEDEAFVRALRGYSTSAFVVQGVRAVGQGSVEVRFATRSDGKVWALVLPLPSAPGRKPWLYAQPDDAMESVQMLGIFLDDEVLTTAIYSARQRDVSDATFVELAPYGLRKNTDQEHDRLARAAVEGGWDGRE